MPAPPTALQVIARGVTTQLKHKEGVCLPVSSDGGEEGLKARSRRRGSLVGEEEDSNPKKAERELYDCRSLKYSLLSFPEALYEGEPEANTPSHA